MNKRTKDQTEKLMEHFKPGSQEGDRGWKDSLRPGQRIQFTSDG